MYVLLVFLFTKFDRAKLLKDYGASLVSRLRLCYPMFDYMHNFLGASDLFLFLLNYFYVWCWQ